VSHKYASLLEAMYHADKPNSIASDTDEVAVFAYIALNDALQSLQSMQLSHTTHSKMLPLLERVRSQFQKRPSPSIGLSSASM
jgi:hypothetical protein